MKTLEVKTSSATYPVYIGDGIKRNIVDLMTSTGHSYTKLLIVTDTAVDAIYGDEIVRLLEQKWSVHKVVVQAERSRNLLLSLSISIRKRFSFSWIARASLRLEAA
ncbi:hypothetical protein ACEQPO_17475 [Bacillus sp. SL00103]